MSEDPSRLAFFLRTYTPMRHTDSFTLPLEGPVILRVGKYDLVWVVPLPSNIVIVANDSYYFGIADFFS